MATLEIEKIEQHQDVVKLSKNATAALEYASSIKITNDQAQEKAVNDLVKIKKEKTRGDQIRRFFTDPLNEQIKKINALFQPSIKALEQAEQTIRTKLVGYQEALANKAEAAKAKTMEKIDTGQLSVEQGVKKIENLKVPEKTVRTETATVSYTIRPRIEVEDESKLPREYLAPDMVKIKTVGLALYKAGQSAIPGTKVVEDKIPSIRGNQ